MEQTITDQYPIMKLLKKAGLKIPVFFHAISSTVYIDKQTKTITNDASKISGYDIKSLNLPAYMFANFDAMKEWIKEVNEHCTCLIVSKFGYGIHPNVDDVFGLNPWIKIIGLAWNTDKMLSLDQIQNIPMSKGPMDTDAMEELDKTLSEVLDTTTIELDLAKVNYTDIVWYVKILSGANQDMVFKITIGMARFVGESLEQILVGDGYYKPNNGKEKITADALEEGIDYDIVDIDEYTEFMMLGKE